MRVLGLIPARGGSRGIPRKNVRLLGGRPLIAWTIESALASRGIDRLVVSTEDDEIASTARRHGAEVPFVRPKELAADETPTLPVVQHALDALAGAGEAYDAVCLLQPTSPFRAPGLIDACIDRLRSADLDCVMTVKALPVEHHPSWAYVPDGDGLLALAVGSGEPPPRRQELGPAFCREGAVYVTRTSVLAGGSLYGARLAGIEVDAATTVNLDIEADWVEAETKVAGPAPEVGGAA